MAAEPIYPRNPFGALVIMPNFTGSKKSFASGVDKFQVLC